MSGVAEARGSGAIDATRRIEMSLKNFMRGRPFQSAQERGVEVKVGNRPLSVRKVWGASAEGAFAIDI